MLDVCAGLCADTAMLSMLALSLSVDSTAHVFVTECDPFCAPQACMEGFPGGNSSERRIRDRHLWFLLRLSCMRHLCFNGYVQHHRTLDTRCKTCSADPVSTGARQILARPSSIERILASKFGSMDQFGLFMDYDILGMLACLVSSVTVLD